MAARLLACVSSGHLARNMMREPSCDRFRTSGLHPLWVADRCLRLTLTPGLPAQQDCKARLAPTAVSN
eukprot:scaffold266_cov22-Tisochrysis_lutea.AAC.1